MLADPYLLVDFGSGTAKSAIVTDYKEIWSDNTDIALLADCWEHGNELSPTVVAAALAILESAYAEATERSAPSANRVIIGTGVFRMVKNGGKVAKDLGITGGLVAWHKQNRKRQI